MATDPLMNDATRIEPILRRSPALVEYLYCDAPLDHAADVAAIANVCALVLGK